MTTTNSAALDQNLSRLLDMLGEGKFLEAMDAFLDDDVVLQEGNDATKRGKAHVMKLEAAVLEGVAEFRGYTVSSQGSGGDKTYYEAVMEYVQTDGEVVRVEQCVVDTWRDGKIVHERFYHA